MDRDGDVHERRERTYLGLPVLGGDYVLHSPAQGVPFTTGRQTLNMSQVTPESVAEAESLTQREASDQVEEPASSPRLVVWAVDGSPRLAWEHVEFSQVPTGQVGRRVYRDVDTGEYIATIDDIHTAEGRGLSHHSGKVPLNTSRVGDHFELIDNRHQSETRVQVDQRLRRVKDSDNQWGTGRRNDPQTLGVDVHYGLTSTLRTLKGLFGLDGLDGAGSRVEAVAVHGEGFINAYWDPEQQLAVFGGGDPRKGVAPLTSLDVVGHELGHGVTTGSANLLYYGESGGLNEATSDILGTAVERFADNPRDPWDYYVGEKIAASGYFRRMDSPSIDGRSFDCFRRDLNYHDPHRSSGVANHFFYLLAEGTGRKEIGELPHRGLACSPMTMDGIGFNAAVQIWFRALTVYMTTATTFDQARDATVLAARDLYGGDDARCRTVELAWKAVGVDGEFHSCAPDARNLLRNGGFEDGAQDWSGETNAISSDGARARSGVGYAVLGGLSTDQRLTTTVAIPHRQHVGMSWHLSIDTEETGQTYDTLTVQVTPRDGEATTLTALGNNDADTTWPWRGFTHDLSRWRGQQVKISFVARNDEEQATTFTLDDISIHARASRGGPTELIPAEALVGPDQAPNAGTFQWSATGDDQTLDPDGERETYLRETTHWCRVGWWGPLGVTSFRHRSMFVSSPRNSEVSMNEDVAVFPDPVTARQAYESLGADLRSDDCVTEFAVTREPPFESDGAQSQSTVLRIRPRDGFENATQHVTVALSGRVLTLIVASSPESATVWDPAWMTTTSGSARRNVAAYASYLQQGDPTDR